MKQNETSGRQLQLAEERTRKEEDDRKAAQEDAKKQRRHKWFSHVIAVISLAAAVVFGLLTL
ncbi:hypothetical protein LG943_07410 [Streptomonospora sp. S1-112]|uniref:Uncharacterized protein n=1 Tax=Streptomonospora mangrovi TaxID=2883123 RepID=A0A9X3NL91_9ACTN|nr:hypothetical protein [Streptomonospora mangrovi]MDA0564153.1 hypothetical protein [Streptomonospora mangrovi]